MNNATSRKRQPAGAAASTGGQFATEARREGDVALSATPAAGVQVTGGEVTDESRQMVDSLNSLRLGPAAVLAIDESRSRFAGDLATAVSDYRVSLYEADFYRISAAGAGTFSDVLLPRDHTPDQLASALREARTKAISDMARQEADRNLLAADPQRPRNARPVTARREPTSGVTEVGFAMPGDHIKVTAYSEGEDAELFARQLLKDGLNDLTARQYRNRLNKVLDVLGPDRDEADRVLRRYLTDVREAADRMHAADDAIRNADPENALDA